MSQKVRNEVDPVTLLKPPGDEQREQLRERADALEEQREQLTNAYEMERIDPKNLDPIREIQNLLSMDLQSVSQSQPGFRYCWEFTGFHGQGITQKKLLGWVVVQGEDPEARELMSGPDTLRRLGDCILMRIPEERYAEIERYLSFLSAQRKCAGEEDLRELAERTGLPVQINSEKALKSGAGRSAGLQGESVERYKQRLVREAAMAEVGRQLKSPDGIPGLPLPGKSK